MTVRVPTKSRLGLRAAIADAATSGTRHFFIHARLQGVEEYSARFGSPMADALQELLVHRLTETVGDEGRAFALGHSEFAVLVDGDDGWECEDWDGWVRAALALVGNGFAISVSTGGVTMPDEQRRPRAVFACAFRASEPERRTPPTADPSRDFRPAAHVAAPDAQDLIRALAHRVGAATGWLGLAGAAYNAGKLAVPLAVLDKPGPLDPVEQRFVSLIGGAGARLMYASDHALLPAAEIADGLAGPWQKSSRESRVLATGLAFAALTSPRPHRPAMSTWDALTQLRAESGDRFEPAIIDALIAELAASAVAKFTARPPRAHARPRLTLKTRDPRPITVAMDSVLKDERRRFARRGLARPRARVDAAESPLLTAIQAAIDSGHPHLLVHARVQGLGMYEARFGIGLAGALHALLEHRLAAAAGSAGRGLESGGEDFTLLVTAGGCELERWRDCVRAAVAPSGTGFALAASWGAVELTSQETRAGDALAAARGSSAPPPWDSGPELVETPDLRAAAYGLPGPVEDLARAVAERLELSPENIGLLAVAASVNDAGKAAVPADVLARPAGLAPAEHDLLALHPRAGEHLMRTDPALAPAAPIVGALGAPWRSAGVPARILAAAVAYDAMCTERPYRPPLSTFAALTALRAEAGDRFDPCVVAALIAVLAEQAVTRLTALPS